MKNKVFKVVSVSKNANGFGLYGHVLVARDGAVFEVGRIIGPWLPEWKAGMEVSLVVDNNEKPTWCDAHGCSIGVEIPRALSKCPAKVVKEIFA